MAQQTADPSSRLHLRRRADDQQSRRDGRRARCARRLIRTSPWTRPARCLRIGARSIQAASATLDTETVSTASMRLTNDFTSQPRPRRRTSRRATTGLLDDENGALSQTLSRAPQKLAELLDENFDPAIQDQRTGQDRRDRCRGASSPERRHQAGDLTRFGRRSAACAEDGNPRRLHGTGRRAERPGAGALREGCGQRCRGGGDRDHHREGICLRGRRPQSSHDESRLNMATWRRWSARKSECRAGRKGDEVVSVNCDDNFGAERRFVLEAKTRRMGARGDLRGTRRHVGQPSGESGDRRVRRSSEGSLRRAIPVFRQQGDRRPRRRLLGPPAHVHVGALGRATRQPR